MPSNVPTPRSASQIINDMLDVFMSKQGLTNVRVGSSILSIFEATGQSQVRSSYDTFKMLNAADISQQTGQTLDNTGKSEKIPRFTLSPATGDVTIGDSSFNKISTTLASNQPAPIVGSTLLNVIDATNFPASGNIYIGRGTPDYEGPIHYTSRTNIGPNWQISLAAATTKFHNTSESVILAQGGNRPIPAGTIVNTPQANISTSVSYSVLYSQTLADGENKIENIKVIAQSPGTVGNCIAGAISSFANPPFTGATVTNPLPISNGIDTESDDDYRERIINIRASKALGTPLALKSAALGATDGISRVSSASFVRQFAKAANLYIDDGTGYEMTTDGVNMESIIDSASGGEQSFQTVERPIAQAFVITQNVAPFNLQSTNQLAVNVGGTTYIHSFAESDFNSISNASAYEVVASINSNPNIGFIARTANGGQNVVILAKKDTNDDIQVQALLSSTGATDANVGLRFPASKHQTLQLYKNDRLLSKDGLSAVIFSNPFTDWTALTSPQTLTISIDNTPSITYTFTDQDFIDSNTGYVTLNKNNLKAWVAVLNNKIPGITASANNGRIALTSNAGNTPKAALSITAGTLLSANIFPIATSIGVPNDYTLDRNNGEIYLSTPLSVNDKLSIGSTFTRAFLESGTITTATLASSANMWFAVDSQAKIVPTGINSNVPFSILPVAVHPWGHILRITASAGTPFVNVIPGDYIIIWDPSVNSLFLQGAYRVVNSTNTYVDIERKEMNGMRNGHRAVAIPSSNSSISTVLITGGTANSELVLGTSSSLILDSAEIYDPNTKISTPVKPMNVPRAFHTATLLSNGKVLVTGGVNNGVSATATDTMEIYDPIADSWTLCGSQLPTGVFHHQATLLQNNNVLITGGTNNNTGSLDTFIVYNPLTDTIVTISNMVSHRYRHKQVLMPNGDVFIVGGIDNSGLMTNTTEIFSHVGVTCSSAASMTRARASFGLALIGTSPTTILAIGNRFSAAGNNSYEIYTIGSNTWGSETTTPNNLVYENKDVVTLPNGHILGLYGYNSVTPTISIGFTYNGTTFTNITSNSLWTDSSAKWNLQITPIADGINTVKNRVVVSGGAYYNSNTFGFSPTANLEEYDEVGAAWVTPDPTTTTSVIFSSNGVSLARTNNYLNQITIPSGTNYTASSLVDALNNVFGGAFASTYLTNQIRISTNTYNNGDIALLSQDTAANGLQISNSSFIPNLNQNVGFVESGSYLGTPLFKDTRVVAVSEVENPSISAGSVTPDYSIVGLKNWMRGIDSTNTYKNATFNYKRFGSNYGFRSGASSITSYSTISDITAINIPKVPWVPGDRIEMAHPFSIGPRDTLSVIVDNDITKQFAINMYRQLKPTNNTYGLTNTFKDLSAGAVSLATTFGLNFSFNDFVAYMAARGVAFSADSTRSMLFRYTRPGADGNGVQVAFGNPIGPNKALATNVIVGSNTAAVIQLGSGAIKNITLDNSARIGQAAQNNFSAHILQVFNLAAASATRTSNLTTLTLTLPSPAVDHGFNVGDVIWVQSTDINFSSGLKPITARTATTISYAEINADSSGTNIGDVSFSSLGECTVQGSGTVIGDWFRFNDPANGPYNNATCYINSVDSNGRNLTVLSGDQLDGANIPFNTTLQWSRVSKPSNVQIFANSNQTANQIATSINALAAQTNPTCPVTATILGTGTGVINQSTVDTLNSAVSYYLLSDGVNWVSDTIHPGSSSGDYQLKFKSAVSGVLSSNSDWQNEIVYICPTTAKNIIDWLTATTVSGLSTVCNIQASDNSRRVQINTQTIGSNGGVQVQGGTANSSTGTVVSKSTNISSNQSYITISNADATGLVAGDWCAIQNTIPAPIFVFGPTSQVSSWTADGLVTFTTPIATRTVSRVQAKLQFERQGQFVAISDMGFGSLASFSTVTPGSWVRIATPTSPTISAVSIGNEGIFKVLRADSSGGNSAGVLFIENTNLVEEQSEAVIEVFTPTSAVPGQNLVILTTQFGNTGTWAIKDVGTTTATSGDSYANVTTLLLDTTATPIVPQGFTPQLGSDSNLAYILENTPSKFIANIIGISPNPLNGANVDIKLDIATASGAPSISAATGSILVALDKLNFPLNYFNGSDAYSYATGLVGKVNTIIYGDPSDPITYPGVASANANININSSIIKRITISLSIRLKTNIIIKDIKNRIKSAVATVINQNPAGNPIAFSEIIKAVEAVVGVKSVVITSPAYNLSSDLIPVQPQEKTQILNLDTDIQVSFLGV